jgi:hypothetical protein
VTAPKAAPQRAGRKPGPRIPCGGCFALLTAREWKGHFAGCPERESPRKLFKLIFHDIVLYQQLDHYLSTHGQWAVYEHGGAKRIGPWRETPIEAVRDCPIKGGKA